MLAGQADRKSIWKSPSLIQIRNEQKAFEKEVARMKSYGLYNQAALMQPGPHRLEPGPPTRPPPSYNAYCPSSSSKQTRSDNSSGQSSGTSSTRTSGAPSTRASGTPSTKTSATAGSNMSTTPANETKVSKEESASPAKPPFGGFGMESFHNRSPFLQERTILYKQFDLLRKEFEAANRLFTPKAKANAFTTVIVMTACINSISILVFEFNRLATKFCETWGQYVQPLVGNDPLNKILRGKPASFLCESHSKHMVQGHSFQHCVSLWEETWSEFLSEFSDPLDVGDVCAANEFIKRALSRLVAVKVQTEKFLSGGRKGGSMMRMGCKKKACERRREQESGMKEAEEIRRKLEAVRASFAKRISVDASKPPTA